LAGFIFASRWLQAPLYIGLIVAQLVYVVVFGFDLLHLVQEVWLGLVDPDVHPMNEATVMLAVLGPIDGVMIANLLKVKLVISISSIHLAFVVSAIALAWIDRMGHRPEPARPYEAPAEAATH